MTTIKTGLKRLTKLADYLQYEVKPKKFDLNTWATIEGNILDSMDDQILSSVLTESVLNPKCGTTACAFGHAGTIKSFRRAGLKLIVDDFAEIVKYEDKEGFDAASEFFGIDYESSLYLFDPGEYDTDNATKKYVVSRIRKFVKNTEKELKTGIVNEYKLGSGYYYW
jgi:hypothetical protein